jgi:hypothetical protein
MILNEESFDCDLTKALVELISKFYSKYSSHVNICTASSDFNKAHQIDNVINGILKEINFNITIQLTDQRNINYEREMRSSVQASSFVFFVDTFHSFNGIFETIEALFSLDYQGYYTIVLLNEFPDQKSKMMDVFKRMWEKYIINVNLIFPPFLTDKRIGMFTYIPFSPINCGQTIPLKINEFRNGKFVIDEHYFPTKTANFYGCKIKVASFNIPPMMMIRESFGDFELSGIDGMLVVEIARRLNFTIDLFHVKDENRWGIMYQNGTSTGAMKLVSFLLMS